MGLSKLYDDIFWYVKCLPTFSRRARRDQEVGGEWTRAQGWTVVQFLGFQAGADWRLRGGHPGTPEQ